MACADPVVLLQVLPLLKTGVQAWQPSDFLPASQDPDFEDKVCWWWCAGAPMPMFVCDCIDQHRLACCNIHMFVLSVRLLRSVYCSHCAWTWQRRCLSLCVLVSCQVRELRKRSASLPDDYLVVFAGELQQQHRSLGSGLQRYTSPAAAIRWPKQQHQQCAPAGRMWQRVSTATGCWADAACGKQGIVSPAAVVLQVT